MTNRQRVLDALKCKPVDRIPWVPFVGVHGGYLLGQTATDYLKSADNLVNGIQTAIDRYKPDGIPVVFDLQIEAEILGCSLNWADDCPPAVISHPLASGKTLDDLTIPSPQDGRIPLIVEATKRLREANPDIALYGLITGPFTLALHLLGTDIFMKMFDSPKSVYEILVFCKDVCVAMCDYFIDAGCDIVAVVDPMTSQIGPDQFQEFVSPYVAPVFEHIRNRDALGSFFVCGHAEQNLQVMCDCKPDNVSVDENIPLEKIRDICLERNVSFGGNLQLTTVLLLGKPIDAQRNAIDCMEIGGDKGFILAPGCDLPYATPAENLDAITQVVLDPYQRQVVKAIALEATEEATLDLSDYYKDDKVIIDIITLDSEACAPCQYMVESVKDIAPEFNGFVEWKEHKVKTPEAIQMMKALGVKNIPTICIDGEIAFVSRIPPRNDLIARVQECVDAKGLQ